MIDTMRLETKRNLFKQIMSYHIPNRRVFQIMGSWNLAVLSVISQLWCVSNPQVWCINTFRISLSIRAVRLCLTCCVCCVVMKDRRERKKQEEERHAAEQQQTDFVSVAEEELPQSLKTSDNERTPLLTNQQQEK